MSIKMHGFSVSRKLQACLLAGVASAALAQSSMPDAQVEANVLRALASSPELANEEITTRTVYGTVTLTGSVRDTEIRLKAETLTANAAGVKKVVDELRLGVVSPSASSGSETPALMLQSDGTYQSADGSSTAQVGSQQPVAGTTPAEQAERNNPDSDQELDRQMEQARQGKQVPLSRSQVPAQGQQPDQPILQSQIDGSTDSMGQNAGAQAGKTPYPIYSPRPYGRRPTYDPNYPGYSSYSQYPLQGAAPNMQRGGQVAGGQEAGEDIVIPAGAMIRVRINESLSSGRSLPGSTFDGIVANDVVAQNLVAIPRGAAVQGKVVDAKSSGVLKGRGEMQIQLTSVTLGGRTYPLVSEVWDHHGGDKTIETINKTAGFGAGGAVIGALAGGGVGAAVGGGIGAALGLGSSAASGNGQVYLPSETMLTFHTSRATSVTTVSEQEMQRLAYGVPAGADPRQLRSRYPVYFAPGYPYPYYRYPGLYRPYGYPNY